MNVLIITGSRHGTRFINELKEEILRADLVVHGGAPGVDSMAESIARAEGVHTCRIDALWKRFGNGAGHRRNRMLDEVGRSMMTRHHVRYAAFPAPDSKGTYNAVDLFTAAPPMLGKVYGP